MKKKNKFLPRGFSASGVHCGVKRKRKDLSLIYSSSRCDVAAVFTRNRVKAVPVLWVQKKLRKKSSARALLVNSGNANCLTGARGERDIKEMESLAAGELGIDTKDVLVSSTGMIGRPMRLEPLLKGIPAAVSSLSEEGIEDAAEGILTTDRVIKVASRRFNAGGSRITLTAIAKGAGMIRPEMATMLCFALTDADITVRAMNTSLRRASGSTFNAITVDGQMSTNDTVLCMANGRAGNERIASGSAAHAKFSERLEEIFSELSEMIVSDGEGATRVMKVNVKGAASARDAKKAALAIADSLLVKCAVHGGDPNWGRIASAAGASGARIDQNRMAVSLNRKMYFKHGEPVKIPEKGRFAGGRVTIDIDLGKGNEQATVLSCDLSEEYVQFNSKYST